MTWTVSAVTEHFKCKECVRYVYHTIWLQPWQVFSTLCTSQNPLFVIQYLEADPFVIALVMLTCAGCHSILWHLSCKLQIEAGYQTVEICIISFCIICFHISLSSLYIAEIFQSYVFILSAKVLVVTYKWSMSMLNMGHSESQHPFLNIPVEIPFITALSVLVFRVTPFIN